jgi:hypothetical protein
MDIEILCPPFRRFFLGRRVLRERFGQFVSYPMTTGSAEIEKRARWAGRCVRRSRRPGLMHFGSRIVGLPDPLRASYQRLTARSGPDFFAKRLRKGLPTSIDELEWQSRILMGLDEIELAATIKAHSIIVDRRNPPRAGGSDGLVSCESAHLDGTMSESLESSGH